MIGIYGRRSIIANQYVVVEGHSRRKQRCLVAGARDYYIGLAAGEWMEVAISSVSMAVAVAPG